MANLLVQEEAIGLREQTTQAAYAHLLRKNLEDQRTRAMDLLRGLQYVEDALREAGRRSSRFIRGKWREKEEEMTKAHDYEERYRTLLRAQRPDAPSEMRAIAEIIGMVHGKVLIRLAQMDEVSVYRDVAVRIALHFPGVQRMTSAQAQQMYEELVARRRGGRG